MANRKRFLYPMSLIIACPKLLFLLLTLSESVFHSFLTIRLTSLLLLRQYVRAAGELTTLASSRFVRKEGRATKTPTGRGGRMTI